MGRIEHTTEVSTSTRGGRLGWRICLRKGCQQRYQASHWRQRYCRNPDCLGELRRWQAAKRQRKRRATAEGRAKHAQAERQRRGRMKNQASSPSGSIHKGARGHAIKKFPPGRSVIGPAVSSPPERLPEPPHATAATSAAGPCVACAIANVSGSPARRKSAASSVAWSTERPAQNTASVSPRVAATWRTGVKPHRALGVTIRSASIGTRRRRR